MTIKRKFLTRTELAAAFMVAPLRITRWTAAGMPVARRGGRGRESAYDLAAVVAWRVETEVQRRTGGAGTNGANHGAGQPAAASLLDLGLERAKLARAQTRRVELEARVREGGLLDAEDVARTWSGLLISVRAKLLALPRAMAERCARTILPEADATVIAQAEALLAGDVHAALRELAAWQSAPTPATEPPAIELPAVNIHAVDTATTPALVAAAS